MAQRIRAALKNSYYFDLYMYANRRSGEQEVVFELNNQNADVSDPGMPAQATRKDKHPLAIMVSGCGAYESCTAPPKSGCVHVNFQHVVLNSVHEY